jgi:hypothetical protein
MGYWNSARLQIAQRYMLYPRAVIADDLDCVAADCIHDGCSDGRMGQGEHAIDTRRLGGLGQGQAIDGGEQLPHQRAVVRSPRALLVHTQCAGLITW